LLLLFNYPADNRKYPPAVLFFPPGNRLSITVGRPVDNCRQTCRQLSAGLLTIVDRQIVELQIYDRSGENVQELGVILRKDCVWLRKGSLATIDRLLLGKSWMALYGRSLIYFYRLKRVSLYDM